MADISEIFAEYWQKPARPGPAEIRARPARPDLSSLRFTTLVKILYYILKFIQ